MLNRRMPSAFRRRPAAFSLVELLVVVGIIALLAGILFPTIAKIRLSAQEADSRSLLNQIDQACLAYYTDFKAYPGPLPYYALIAGNQSTGEPIYNAATGGTLINTGTITAPGTASTEATLVGPRITGAENLVLGLCGGLARNAATGQVYFDSAAVGQGAVTFNPLRPGRSNAYLQAQNLSKGQLVDDAGQPSSADSIIPEFMDKFATPMPFLYMRSRGNGVSSPTTPPGESLIINNGAAAADYNILEIQPYTSFRTPGGSTLKQSDYVTVTFDANKPHGLRTANPARSTNKGTQLPGITYQYPFDAYDYFVDPSSYDRAKTSAPTAAETAAKRTRKKDSFVLISAGRDRVYGTADDLTNFGTVLP